MKSWKWNISVDWKSTTMACLILLQYIGLQLDIYPEAAIGYSMNSRSDRDRTNYQEG